MRESQEEREQSLSVPWERRSGKARCPRLCLSKKDVAGLGAVGQSCGSEAPAVLP